MTTTEQSPETQQYSVIGTRPIRHDGVDKVTGRALYGADIQLNGLLHGCILRSPHAHARILKIDASRARAPASSTRSRSRSRLSPSPVTGYRCRRSGSGTCWYWSWRRTRTRRPWR